MGAILGERETMTEQFKEFSNRETLVETCDKHGSKLWRISIPSQGKDRPSVFCPDCAREEIKQKETDLLNQSANKERYYQTYNVLERDSIISPKIKMATLANFKAETAEEKQLLLFCQNQVTEYLNGLQANTLITGPTGVGKSHLCFGIAKAINEGFKAKNEPKSVLFVTFTEIVNKIQDGWAYGRHAELTKHDAVKLLTRPDYLVIDDLGAKNAVIKPKNDWEQDLLFDILNNRYNTIINTNLSGDELRKVYNERNYSRILEGLNGNAFTIRTIKDKRYGINQLRQKSKGD